MSRKQVGSSFSFVYSGRPLSYNCTDKRKKEAYMRRISSTYLRKYVGSIIDSDLYAIVYYFFKDDVNLDADNISKPVWDSLSSIGYMDDNQIKIRTAVAIDVNKHSIMDFDQDNLSTDDVFDLFESIFGNEHTLYIQVGRIENYNNLINLPTLWQ